jgi:hypothetical protein
MNKFRSARPNPMPFRLTLATCLIMNLALLPLIRLILGHDAARTTVPEAFPGEALLNRITYMIQLWTLPLSCLAAIGLTLRKSWGGLLAMLGLGLLLGQVLMLPAIALVIPQSSGGLTGTGSGIGALLVGGMVGSIGWLIWSSRKYLT